MLECDTFLARVTKMHIIKINLAEFSAAHRLVKGYTGKCQNLHGHSYKVEITMSSSTLDEYDFVTDFSDIKKYCKAWVDDNLDHATIVSDVDTPLLEFLQQENQKHYLITGGHNTTVECLSKHLFEQLTALVAEKLQPNSPNLELRQVEVWETRTCSAIYGQDLASR